MTHGYRFDDVLIDQQSFRLWQAGRPISVEPKALNVLIFLVQKPGRLIERRELMSAVWGDAFVSDHVLSRAIGQLRRVLGDDVKEPRYIETVPTLGYRFIATVEVETPDIPVPLPEEFESVAAQPYERLESLPPQTLSKPSNHHQLTPFPKMKGRIRSFQGL
jgi:DNA-binding winged helix-turn-helix (wHTH) protein